MNRYHIGDMIIHHDINHIIRKINNFLNIVWSIGWQKAEINISFVVPSIQNKHYISDFSPTVYSFVLRSSGRRSSSTSGKRTLRRNGPDNLTVQCVPANASSLKHQSLPGSLQELVVLKMDQLEPQSKQ